MKSCIITRPFTEPRRFCSRRSMSNGWSFIIVGDFRRKLSHHAARILLQDSRGNPVNEVTYFNEHPWPAYSNGGGSSLELRNPRMDNRLPESWAASREGTKSEWKHYSFRAK